MENTEMNFINLTTQIKKKKLFSIKKNIYVSDTWKRPTITEIFQGKKKTKMQLTKFLVFPKKFNI